MEEADAKQDAAKGEEQKVISTSTAQAAERSKDTDSGSKIYPEGENENEEAPVSQRGNVYPSPGASGRRRRHGALGKARGHVNETRGQAGSCVAATARRLQRGYGRPKPHDQHRRASEFRATWPGCPRASPATNVIRDFYLFMHNYVKLGLCLSGCMQFVFSIIHSLFHSPFHTMQFHQIMGQAVQSNSLFYGWF